MKTLTALFLYDRDINKPWLMRVVEKANKRLAAAMGLTLEARYAKHSFKPPFVHWEREKRWIEKWIPEAWMRENVGLLTGGEHIAFLCLSKKLWPRDSAVIGRVEYNPYNGVTFLSHICAERNREIPRGDKNVDMTEDNIIHELLHTFESQTNKYGIVHANVNDLDAAARLLKVELDKLTLLASLKAQLADLLARLRA